MAMTTANDGDSGNVAAVAQINAAANATFVDVATPNSGALSESVAEEPTNTESNSRAASVDPVLTGNSLKCQCLPHGAYGFIISLLSMMAWIVTLSKDGCDYARVVGPIVADITNNPDTPFIEAGLNRYRAPTLSESGDWVLDNLVQCEEYNPDVVTIDSAWSVARLTSFLGLVLGGGGAMFILLSSCLVFRESTWRWAGHELLAAVVFQMLTYSWFATSICHGNNNGCELNYGSRADILACVMWGASALCIFLRYPSERTNSRQASDPIPPTVVAMPDQAGEVEMSDRSRERSVSPALGEHEII